MSEKTINFDNKKINRNNFFKTKRLSKIDDINIDKILISKKEANGKKVHLNISLLMKIMIILVLYVQSFYIGILCIKLLQMIGYAKCFDNNKTMSFKVTDNDLLEKYTKIWRRVSNLMNIEFDSEPVYGDSFKYIKTKIRMHEDKVNTNLQCKETLKENASYDCLSLITLDSVIRVNKRFYPRALLEECKYKVRKNKRYNLINDDLELDSESDNVESFS